MKQKCTIALLFSFTIILNSCSVSQKINKTARRTILSTAPFAPAHTGIAIYDADAERFIYEHQADKYFVPASNTKIITCYAAMRILKDSVPAMKYEVVNDSTINIEPLGDPTFLHTDYSCQPVYQLLKNYKYIKITDQGFTDFLGNGWSWDDYLYSYMAQKNTMPVYGNIATAQLRNGQIQFKPSYFNGFIKTEGNISDGFQAKKRWDTNNFEFTTGRQKKAQIPFIPDLKTVIALLADTLHSHVEVANTPLNNAKIMYSRPLDSVLKPMMHRSDNFFAEQMLLSAGHKLTGSFEERKILDTLSALLLSGLPHNPVWVDGSGLSRYNLFTPKDFVNVLAAMKKDFGVDRLKNILPTGGTGTLSSLYRDEGDYIFAKTGTLNGVVALSGFLYTRKNKLLIFSVLINNHNASSTEIREGIERFLKNIR